MHCGPPNQNFGWAMAHPTILQHPHGYMKLDRNKYRDSMIISIHIRQSTEFVIICHNWKWEIFEELMFWVEY